MSVDLSIIGGIRPSPHSPFPQAVMRLVVHGVAVLAEDHVDLAGVVAFVRDEVADEGRGMRLESLYLAAARGCSPEELLDRLAGCLEAGAQLVEADGRLLLDLAHADEEVRRGHLEPHE